MIGYKTFKELGEEKWNEFLMRDERSNFYHTHAWARLVRNAFSNEPGVWFIERDGQIASALPGTFVKYPVFGTKLISLPNQACAGGPMGDRADWNALVEAAVTDATKRNARYVEVRNAFPIDLDGFSKSEPLFWTETHLENPEAMQKKLVYNHRWGFRKAAKLGLEVIRAETREHWDAFYDVYLRMQRHYAMPPYDRTFFNELFQSKGAVLFVARTPDKWVGGALLLCFNKTSMYKLGACREDMLSFQPYNALVWKSMSWSAENGLSFFNHGTTPRNREGLLKFKEGWNGVTQTVHTLTKNITGKAPDLDSYYDGYQLAKKIWKKLPLPITALAGRHVNKWVC